MCYKERNESLGHESKSGFFLQTKLSDVAPSLQLRTLPSHCDFNCYGYM